MNHRTIELSLAPLAVAGAATIGSLRLLAAPSGPLLVTSTTGPAAPGGYATTYASTPLAAPKDASVLADVRQILAVPPRWDVGSDDRGASVIVYEVAGGAMNALALRHVPSGQGKSLPTPPFKSFGQPRFFKGQRPSVSAVSVSAVADGQQLVVLSTAAPFTPLVEAVDGLVVRWDPGYVLLYKAARPGPVRGSDLCRGVLRCARLGDDFRPTGQVIAPFGDATVFEVDADIHGTEIVVLVTTEAGVALSQLQVEADSVGVLSRRSVQHEAELIRPAIVTVGAELHVAVLREAVAEPERLWTGRVNIQP